MCRIIISYCELKLKFINIVFVLKREKEYYTVEDRRPGKIIILRGINNKIIISRLSYSDLYLDEAKYESSTK